MVVEEIVVRASQRTKWQCGSVRSRLGLLEEVPLSKRSSGRE